MLAHAKNQFLWYKLVVTTVLAKIIGCAKNKKIKVVNGVVEFDYFMNIFTRCSLVGSVLAYRREALIQTLRQTNNLRNRHSPSR